jgi:hypothetical protein
MNKLLPLLAVLILVLLVSCKNTNGPKYVQEKSTIAVSTNDTINSKYFSSILKEDSIKLLDFQKSTTDTIEEESIKYIDFKKNNPDKKKIYGLDLKKLSSEAINYADSTNISSKISIAILYPELIGTYVPVEKYNKDYCMYYIDINYFVCLADSMHIARFMDGDFGCYYQTIDKVDNKYIIDLEEGSYSTRIEIKVLEDKYNSSVWRFSDRTDSTKTVIYKLFVPSTHISEIPILYTLYSGGLDDIFEGFDDISLKDLFNK